MNTRFRLCSATLGRLREHAIAPEAVLRRAGLPATLLRDDQVALTTEQLFAFWQAVAEVSGDPAIGLALAGSARAQLDVVSIAALSAATLGDALARAARYKQLTCPEEIEIEAGRSECAVQFRWLLASEMTSPVLLDLCFAWVAELARRGTDGAVRPHRVELRRAARDRKSYQAHFGCTVRFNAERDALIFRSTDLDREFVTANDDLLGMLTSQLEARLSDHRAGKDVRDQVRRVLRRLLTGRRPDLRDVARELAASPRTLQRRLGDAGASYQALLEETRAELARHYLLNSSLELAEIAYLLGYEDGNSFVRAFHRWVGEPPRRWRDAQRARPAPRP